jgi:hypothetical protein
MKQMLLLLMFIPAVVSAQFSVSQMPTRDGALHYEFIGTIDSSFTEDQIYSMAKDFVTHALKSGDAIQLDDMENRVVKGKGSSSYSWDAGHGNESQDYSYTLEMNVMPGRYKVMIYDITGPELMTHYKEAATSKSSLRAMAALHHQNQSLIDRAKAAMREAPKAKLD